MKLSAFSIADDYVPAENSQRLAEVVGLAEACESAGLSALWVAEHHFQPGGVCPSPPVLLAACGARTRRIRLGAMVSVLPFHSPIEIAEQYSMVDRLLQGRLNLGVGSGYIAHEFDGFGIDPATKRERFDAAFEKLRAALSGEEVRADGERGVPVRLNVLPVQRPYPPFWVAVQRRDAIPFVARKGVSIALIPYATLDGLSDLKEEVDAFRAHGGPGPRHEVAAAIHLYSGPRPEHARAAFQRYLDSRRATQSSFYLEKVQRDPRHATAAAVEESGWALFGEPNVVARRLEEFEAIGVDELLGIFDFGGLPPEEVAGSVRSLGRAFLARR